MGDYAPWIAVVKYEGDKMPTVTLVGDEDDGPFKELVKEAVKIAKSMQGEGIEVAVTPVRISGNYIAFFPEDDDEDIDDIIERYW